jgi:3-oxoacyl-ACP reductase-like protein
MFQSAMLIDDDVPFGLRASVDAALKRLATPTWDLPAGKLQEIVQSLLTGTRDENDLLAMPSSSASLTSGDDSAAIYEISLL